MFLLSESQRNPSGCPIVVSKSTFTSVFLKGGLTEKQIATNSIADTNLNN